MEKKNFGKTCPDELCARAVRLVLDHDGEYRSRSAAIPSVSQTVGCCFSVRLRTGTLSATKEDV